MDHYGKAYPVFSRIQGYRGLQKVLYSLRNFEESAVVKQRMKIIRFYETYGEKATKEAFGADRKVISRWKKRLTDNGGIVNPSTYSSQKDTHAAHPLEGCRLYTIIAGNLSGNRQGEDQASPGCVL